MTDPQHENAAFLSIDRAFEAVVAELQEKLRTSPPVIRTYMKHLLQSQGKLIRARCLLGASISETGTVPHESVQLALAVELVHLASLVHDDVIDDAPLRRNNETLQKKFGKKTAVICGDWLLCLALSIASQVSSLRGVADVSLVQYLSRLCLGELSQQEHTGDLNLSYYRYLAIIRGKTAALFEAAFFCGASLACAEKTDIRALTKFGRYFGLVFQLLDDCIDYEQEETVAGKPVKSDFSQGVITLPLIYALRSDGQFKKEIQKCTAPHVVERVKKSGGVLFTKKVAQAYHRKALQILEQIHLTEQKKALLRSLIKKAAES